MRTHLTLHHATLLYRITLQVSKNVSKESAARGWTLLSLFLETFKPSVEFENYLENFLRAKAPNKERYLKLLHTTMYCGNMPLAPSASEIQKVISGGSIRKVDFSERRSYKPPRPSANDFGDPLFNELGFNTSMGGGGVGSKAPSSGPPSPGDVVEGNGFYDGQNSATSKWRKALAPDGGFYYYHLITMDTVWDPPPDY
jgi:hypothetical protein